MSKRMYISVAMEASSVYLILNSFNPVLLFLYSLLHSTASFLLASSFAMFSKKFSKKEVIIVLGLTISLSGPLGYIVATVVYLFIISTKRRVVFIERLSREFLSVGKTEKVLGGEAFVLSKSLKTLFYVGKEYKPYTVKFLKEAVSWENDEARLFAFSTLSGIETDLANRITTLKANLERAKDEQERFSIFLSLAELNWEFVFMGIADEELVPFYLNQAEEYLEKALQIKEEPKACFLLARLSLRKRDFERAKECLLKAMELGFPKERLAPYLIEVLYYKKDFKELSRLLKDLKEVYYPDYRTSTIMRVWT